jgi:hypothetical protein
VRTENYHHVGALLIAQWNMMRIAQGRDMWTSDQFTRVSTRLYVSGQDSGAHEAAGALHTGWLQDTKALSSSGAYLAFTTPARFLFGCFDLSGAL